MRNSAKNRSTIATLSGIPAEGSHFLRLFLVQSLSTATRPLNRMLMPR